MLRLRELFLQLRQLREIRGVELQLLMVLLLPLSFVFAGLSPFSLGSIQLAGQLMVLLSTLSPRRIQLCILLLQLRTQAVDLGIKFRDLDFKLLMRLQFFFGDHVILLETLDLRLELRDLFVGTQGFRHVLRH